MKNFIILREWQVCGLGAVIERTPAHYPRAERSFRRGMPNPLTLLARQYSYRGPGAPVGEWQARTCACRSGRVSAVQ